MTQPSAYCSRLRFVRPNTVLSNLLLSPQFPVCSWQRSWAVSLNQCCLLPLKYLFNRAFQSQTCWSLGVFLVVVFFFAPFSVNSGDCCAWKSWQILRVWHQQSFHGQIHLDQISLPCCDAWSEQQQHLLSVSACFNAFSSWYLIGRLEVYINQQVFRCTQVCLSIEL